jgi:TPR repeat protein
MIEKLYEECISGNSSACNQLYDKAVELRKENSIEDALKIFSLLCSKGNRESCMAIRFLYNENRDLVGSKLEELYNGGSIEAGYQLGTIYLKSNIEKAMEIFEDICAKRHGGGCYQVGKRLLENGNAQKAISKFKTSCNLGCGEGCYMVFEIFKTRMDIQLSPREILEYLEKGVKLNNIKANYEYAKFLIKQKHIEDAIKNLEIACQAKYLDSCDMLESLKKTISQSESSS